MSAAVKQTNNNTKSHLICLLINVSNSLIHSIVCSEIMQHGLYGFKCSFVDINYNLLIRNTTHY